MLIKCSIIYIFTSFTTQILSLVDRSLDNDNWSKELVRYLTNESKVKDLILITEFDQRFQHRSIDKILRGISSCNPSISITFDNLDNWGNTNLMQLSSTNLSSTKLYLLLLNSTNSSPESRLSRPIKFLTKVSGVNSRPNILIVHLPEKGVNFAYRKLFREMWSKQFLDVTVLQIIERELCQQSKIWQRNSEAAFVFRFNPFTGIYDKQKFSNGSQLFPNKLLDLNNHVMKAGLTHDPPFSIVKRNLSGHPIQITGPNPNTWTALSEKLNFQINFIPSEENTGLVGCNKTEFTGLYRKIVQNEVKFLGTYAYYFSYCNDNSLLYSTTRFLDEDIYVAVVPRVFDDTSTVTLPMKTVYTLIITVIVINFTWAVLIYMKFDNQVWNPITMFQSVLGFSINNEPQKLAERIVFCSLLITQLIFSSYLFTNLTHVIISSNSMLEINSFEDLKNSNLTPMIHALLNKVVKKDGGDVRSFIADKYLLFPGNGLAEDCLSYLAKYKNVSCITKGVVAESLIKEYGTSEELAAMKILKEPLWSNWRMFVLEPNSPYIERFNQVLLDLVENGLMRKWNENDGGNHGEPSLNEVFYSAKLSIKIFIVPAIGFLLAWVTFIAEVLIAAFKSN